MSMIYKAQFFFQDFLSSKYRSSELLPMFLWHRKRGTNEDIGNNLRLLLINTKSSISARFKSHFWWIEGWIYWKWRHRKSRDRKRPWPCLTSPEEALTESVFCACSIGSRSFVLTIVPLEGCTGSSAISALVGAFWPEMT